MATGEPLEEAVKKHTKDSMQKILLAVVQSGKRQTSVWPEGEAEQVIRKGIKRTDRTRIWSDRKDSDVIEKDAKLNALKRFKWALILPEKNI